MLSRVFTRGTVRDRPKRCFAGFRASFCFSFWAERRRKTGRTKRTTKHKQNEKHRLGRALPRGSERLSRRPETAPGRPWGPQDGPRGPPREPQYANIVHCFGKICSFSVSSYLFFRSVHEAQEPGGAQESPRGPQDARPKRAPGPAMLRKSLKGTR